jgi:lysophospholipase L1-like esterase
MWDKKMRDKEIRRKYNPLMFFRSSQSLRSTRGNAFFVFCCSLGAAFTTSLLMIANVYSDTRSYVKALRYLPVGDSYTIGQSVSQNERFPNQLAEKARAAGFPLEIVANPAVSGFTVSDALKYELPVVTRTKPEFVTVLLGANDFVRDVPAEVFRAQFKRLLRELRNSLGYEALIVTISVPNFLLSPGGREFTGYRSDNSGIETFNSIIKEESAHVEALHIDIFDLSTRLAPDFEMFVRDGLHPSGKQYQEWAALLWTSIKPALVETFEGREAFEGSEK